MYSEPRGLPGARNLGAAQASGEYLCLLDADDILEPHYLERSIGVLESQPALAFASHWFRTFGDEEWEWKPDRCDLAGLLDSNTVNGAALLRRSVFDAVGGFDESLTDGCEDWDFWIRVLEHGHHGTIIPEFLFRYRRRPDSMSRTMMTYPGLPELYRQLIHRHTSSFRTHWLELLRRRDADIAASLGDLWKLDLEWAGGLEGELQWERDTHTAVHRLRSRDSDSEPSALAAAQREVQRLGAILGATEREVLRLDAARNREAASVDELTRSWSWRVTAPLRRLLRRTWR